MNFPPLEAKKLPLVRQFSFYRFINNFGFTGVLFLCTS